jgi:hypothetical protein
MFLWQILHPILHFETTKKFSCFNKMFHFYDALKSFLNISIVFLLVLTYKKDTKYHTRCLHFHKDPSCIRALCNKYTNHENKKIAYIAKFICKHLPSDVSVFEVNLYHEQLYKYWENVRMNGSKALIIRTIHSICQHYIKDLKDQTSILTRINKLFLEPKQNFRDLYFEQLDENDDFILFKDKTLAVSQDLIVLVSLTIKAIFKSMDEKFYRLYRQTYKNNKLGIVFKDFTRRVDDGYYIPFLHELSVSNTVPEDDYQSYMELLIHEFAHSINTNPSIMMSKQYSPTLCESLCKDYKTDILEYSGTEKHHYYMFTNPIEYHSEMISFWIYNMAAIDEIKPSYTESILWGFKKNGVNNYFGEISQKRKSPVKQQIQQIPSQDLIKLVYDANGTKT